MLVALGLSALVVTLLLAGLDITRRILARQAVAAREGMAAQVEPLRRMAAELQSAMDPGDGTQAFDVQRDSRGWTLRWVTAQPVPGLPGTYEPVRVEYRFDGNTLRRSEWDRVPSTDEPAAATLSAPGLRAIEIELHDSRAWRPDGPDREDSPFPGAVRLRLVTGRGHPLLLETPVPAGETWQPAPPPP